MNTRFLVDVLPALSPGEHYYAVGIPCGNQQPIHHAYTSVDGITYAANIFSTHNINAYYALGSFNGNGRRAANTTAFRSFWLDIDVGKPKNSYVDITAALTALQQFNTTTGLVPSYLVSSGMGLHVYWCMTENVPSTVWFQTATRFKEFVLSHGLIVDPTCTTDRARILRVPGSVHCSSGNVVTILWTSDKRYTLEEFSAPLPNVSVPLPTATSTVSDNMLAAFGMGPNEPTYNAQVICDHCAQVRNMGYGTEPVWFAAMSVLKRCVDGAEFAHRLSALDTERYNYAICQAKFDHAPKDAPATCARFQTLNPTGCDGCKMRGTITSPAELHRRFTATPVAETQVQASMTLPVALPTQEDRTMPSSFMEDDKGIYYVDVDNDGNKNIKHISHCQIYYIRKELAHGLNNRDPDYIFRVTYPNKEGTRILRMKVVDFEKNPKLWLSSQELRTIRGQENKLVGFLQAYLSSVIYNGQKIEKFPTYGWTKLEEDVLYEHKESEMGFVVEGAVITQAGAVPCSSTQDVDSPIRKVFTQRGTLDAWKIVPALYRAMNQPLGQLAMCFAFAAPLMKYGSGEAKNCIFNVYSQEGGKGKSFLLRAAASIWGNPSYAFFQKDSSVVAREKRLALWRNLPAMMDELTFMGDADIAQLVFAIISGEEKQKLTRDSEFKITGSWSTCVFATANKPLKDSLSSIMADSDAGVKRVLDYECNFKTPDPAQMQLIHLVAQVMESNYGLAGPEFIHQLLMRPERMRTLQQLVATWVEHKNFQPDERFYSYPLGLALQAGRWACEFGLLEYDMDALETWVLAEYTNGIRATDSRLRVSPEDMLDMFINEHISKNAVIVRREDRLLTEMPQVDPKVPDAYVLRTPQNAAVLMRYEVEESTLYIAVTAFDDWLKRKGWSHTATVKKLEQSGKLTVPSRSTKRNLSKNIKWLTPTKLRCYVINSVKVPVNGLEQSFGYGVPKE